MFDTYCRNCGDFREAVEVEPERCGTCGSDNIDSAEHGNLKRQDFHAQAKEDKTAQDIEDRTHGRIAPQAGKSYQSEMREPESEALNLAGIMNAVTPLVGPIMDAQNRANFASAAMSALIRNNALRQGDPIKDELIPEYAVWYADRLIAELRAEANAQGH